jgi:hypothetical protein
MAKIQNDPQKVKKCYVSYLETLPWTYFITGSTRYELTLKSTRRLAERWFEAIKTNGSILFWVAEKFECKDGYHMHGLLYIPNPYKEDTGNVFLFQRLVDHWQLATGNKALSIDKSNRVEWDKEKWNALNLKRYDKKRGAGGYCAKYVFKRDADYDLLC